jgi:hypothetical protein
MSRRAGGRSPKTLPGGTKVPFPSFCPAKHPSRKLTESTLSNGDFAAMCLQPLGAVAPGDNFRVADQPGAVREACLQRAGRFLLESPAKSRFIAPCPGRSDQGSSASMVLRASLGQVSPNPERWGSLRFVDPILVPGCRQECMRAAVYRAKAHDLAHIIDPLSAHEIPA